MPKIRTYTDLIQIPTFEERFKYLKLNGSVGQMTFGSERYINQRFYSSTEWKRIRDIVISRDNGCDLACPDHEIYGKIMVHHICPITPDALEHSDIAILDPNFLISCSMKTHNAIHFGDLSQVRSFIERKPGDTRLW